MSPKSQTPSEPSRFQRPKRREPPNSGRKAQRLVPRLTSLSSKYSPVGTLTTRLTPSVRSGGARMKSATLSAEPGSRLSVRRSRRSRQSRAIDALRNAVQQAGRRAVDIRHPDRDAREPVPQCECPADTRRVRVCADFKVLDGGGGVQQHVAVRMRPRHHQEARADRIWRIGTCFEFLARGDLRTERQAQAAPAASVPCLGQKLQSTWHLEPTRHAY